MIISLVSPKSGQCGTSSVGILVAMYMSLTTNKEITYLPIQTQIDDICSWQDVENNKSIIKSTSQIYKLMISGNMNLSDIRSYATELTSKIDLYDMTMEALSDEERIDVQSYLINNLPYNSIFLDIGGRYNTVEGRAAIEESQIVIMVTNCMDNNISQSLEMLKDEIYDNKKKFLVINMQHNDNKDIVQIKGKSNKKVDKMLRECVIFPLTTRIPSYQNERIFEKLAEHIVDPLSDRIDLEVCRSAVKELSELILANIGDKRFLGGE